jgi:hypothetical protein
MQQNNSRSAMCRLTAIERKHRGRRRGTLIVRQDDDNADLYHGDSVTYSGAELDRMAAGGVQVIIVAYTSAIKQSFT